MMPAFLSRLHAAAALIFKSGAPFPFNKIMPYDATGGEKMHRAYEQSAWVMRAIKKVAGPISAVELRFARGGERFEDDELDAFWQTPAVGMTRPDFLEATVSWLKLEGEAFWILDDAWLTPFQNPQLAGRTPPMIVARPDRMRHVVKNGQLEGWEFVDGAGRRALLLPEQVIQTKMWNPYHDWRGLAELKPCHDAAEADFMAGKFNLNLMRNNGDQGVYVIAKNGVPTDAQRQQIVDQIREKREMAQRGVFKPVFLGGDIVIEDPKIRVPDADFNATRLQNRHEIFIALGVPPSMADVKASYSIGSASDWFMLISETCIPLGEKICASIAQVLRRQSGLSLTASFNWDEHPVIQAVRRERADTAQKYFQMGVPLKVLNDYLDLELPACPAWETGYLPFNVAPVGGGALPEKSGALAEPMDDTVALMRAALEKRREAGGAGIISLEPPFPGPLLHQLVEEREKDRAMGVTRSVGELAQWRELMGQRREMVKAFESRFNRETMKARTEVLRRLERQPDTGDLLDWNGFARGLGAALKPVTQTALLTAGRQFFAEIGCGAEFVPPPERVAKLLKWREGIWAAAAEKMRREIQQAAESAPAGAKADAVRARFNEISKRLAPAAAADEMGAAFGLARDAAMEQAGVTTKRWLCSGHDQVRPAHAAANGQEASVEGSFTVGGEALRHPCDENGTAANVRNCQCVAVAGGGNAKGGARVVTDFAGSEGKDLSAALWDPRARREPPHPGPLLHQLVEGREPERKAAPRGMEGGGRLVRLIHPEVRIVDARRGIVDYIASDESIDSFREVIRAAGWRFTNFSRNAPFVDSHDYSSIEKCLGRVVDFRVEGPQLIERVQWAIDVPENQLAQIGWKMTQAGYLKAVSVGFFPVKYLTPSSGPAWAEQLRELGLPADAPVRTIYTEQEQVELSCCVVGANPNALAKAYRAGAIDDADLSALASATADRETISRELTQRENARAADSPALAAQAREQARQAFLEKLQLLIKQD